MLVLSWLSVTAVVVLLGLFAYWSWKEQKTPEKLLARVFLGGTSLFLILFLVFSWDSLKAIQVNTHEEAMTAHVVAGKVAWQTYVCIDCHTAHDIDNPLTLEWHERIPQMCGNCHANPEIARKYGLSTEVLKAYLSDFHGVTLGLYKKQREALYKPARPIAVCTDCHGTHNINSTVSTDPANVKANLVKRCQKCHKDANENFPNAWLSHYKPSLSKFPLIFIVSLTRNADAERGPEAELHRPETMTWIGATKISGFRSSAAGGGQLASSLATMAG